VLATSVSYDGVEGTSAEIEGRGLRIEVSRAE